MARPQKQGLDYFSLDVNLDDKFQIIEAEHGLEGFAICIKLLQKIYSEGYYYPWGEMEQILFSKSVSVVRNSVTTVVNDCIKWGLFSQEMYEKHGILTSNGIQKRFITSVYKRVKVDVIAEYMLIDVSDIKNVRCISVSDDGNEEASGVSDDGSTQSKVKKRKEDEEEKKSTPTPEILEKINFHSERPLIEIFNEMDENRLWKEQMCMKHAMPGSTVEIKLLNFDKYLSQFYTFLTVDKQIKQKSLSDTYSHFSNWLPKQIVRNE